ncbi:hypothetical protein GGR55DRAFT_678314 [Xylaria sp. FL0064]|nr:hypothetical protein GGR55DRAFT_678314 [Xylaria sp. FL0064]
MAQFRQIEAQRAKQRFLVAPDRDLVYVTDPRHPALFLQLWKSPWCKEVQYLALLVCDCMTETDWLGVNLWKMVGDLWQPNEPGPFDESKLKEITLVAKPSMCALNYTRENVMLLEHNIYGFMNYTTYEALRDVESFPLLFEVWDRHIVDETFDSVREQLEPLLPERLRRRVNFNYVIDIDCINIGMTDIVGEGTDYTRTFRGRRDTR